MALEVCSIFTQDGVLTKVAQCELGLLEKADQILLNLRAEVHPIHAMDFTGINASDFVELRVGWQVFVQVPLFLLWQIDVVLVGRSPGWTRAAVSSIDLPMLDFTDPRNAPYIPLFT